MSCCDTTGFGPALNASQLQKFVLDANSNTTLQQKLAAWINNPTPKNVRVVNNVLTTLQNQYSSQLPVQTSGKLAFSFTFSSPKCKQTFLSKAADLQTVNLISAKVAKYNQGKDIFSPLLSGYIKINNNSRKNIIKNDIIDYSTLWGSDPATASFNNLIFICYYYKTTSPQPG